MQGIRLFLFALLLLVVLGSCTSTGAEPPTEESLAFAEREELTPYQKDFRYFWKRARRDYPYWGVAERRGVSPKSIFTRYYSQITPDTTQEEMRQLLEKATASFGHIGHMSGVASDASFSYYYGVYDQWDHPFGRHLIQMMDEAMNKGAYQLVSTALENQTKAAPASNLETQVLEEGEIAFVKVRSFDHDYIEHNGPAIRSFFEEIDLSSYSHLILDIRGNQGGNSLYWITSFVEPLLQFKVEEEFDFFYRNTKETRAYMAAFWGDAPDGTGQGVQPTPIYQHPLYLQMNQEDRTRLTHYVTRSNVYWPEENSIPFEGKIWLLVDEDVYSAASSLAHFCHKTGFASLVGTHAGRGGAGINPPFYMLPNAGILWRQDPFYTINPDGSCTEETSLPLDYTAPYKGAELETCLAAIAEQSTE